MDDDKFYSRLKHELDEWQKDGVLESSQAEAIMRRYGIEKKGYKQADVITALSTLAAILIGVGVILFFASNWEKMPDIIKVILLLITTFSTYYAGFVMRFEKKTYPTAGHALLFLGSVLVGATILLIAQIFNINAGSHWLYLLWFIVIAPMGYFFDSKPTVGLNIIIFTLWLGVSIIGDSYMGMSSPLLLYLLFGIALYSIGQIHELTGKWSGFRMVYKGFGIFFILISYFYFSIWPTYFFYSHYAGGVKFTASDQLLMGVFALLAVASVVANLVEKEKLRSTRYEFYVLVSAFVGWIFLFIINMYPILQQNRPVETLLFIIFNLFLLGISIGTISIGYYKNQPEFVNTGIIFFALGVMQYYINHLQGMLPKGLGLIIGGIILFFIASYLEKKRRILLAAMKVPVNE
ncbi:MAG: DUF2157 domain-containing protein [Candidatus Methanoperedens sp.]|jgi:uncharacterized membrane protein|nr:DUF2157 domain-containing protein [Candidatus Methanoperedens sp.]PKL53885.1 MAG: hypothetical protein CVV36_04680 [Candidatus Methanoperedenaceae archaeon HGW-Methanoperedenaceae-1]